MNLVVIQQYFVLFLFYSFCGWAIETIGEFIKSHKFVNRGFLIGPICPIYGIGAVLITVLLTRYSEDYFAIFGLSAILCGVLEYFTSYLMEKLFKHRWWDYSNFKFNINGRICLETIIWFAIAGLGIILVINPFLQNNIVSKIPDDILGYIFYFLGTILLVDIVFSFNVMNKIKDISLSVSSQVKDSTEEISSKIREVILEKSTAYKRVLEAFPQAFATKIKKTTENINNATRRTIRKINVAKKKTIRRFKTK